MKDEKPVSKGVAAAIRTAKWAVTMTKWTIGFETGGRKLGGNIKRSKRWQIVPFPGQRQSTGLGSCLDFLTIFYPRLVL